MSAGRSDPIKQRSETPTTRTETVFQARLVYGPADRELEDREWTDLDISGPDFDDVLDRAREAIEPDEKGMLVIAEMKIRYHVIV